MTEEKIKENTHFMIPFEEPINLFFLTLPDNEFSEYLKESHDLVSRYPEILASIDADLDKRAKCKKKLRLLDQQWELSKTKKLPGMPMKSKITLEEINEEELELKEGCPRMDAYLVYMFMMMRGFHGGIKTSELKLFFSESKTIEIFLSNCNKSKRPGFSTISENINAVSNYTRELIFDYQILMIWDDGLDDFKELTIDSTSVKGNSAWPTDSGILTGLVMRLYHRGKKLHKFGIRDIADRRFPTIIKNMRNYSKQISFGVNKPKSKIKRKRLYRKLLKEAGSGHKLFLSELNKVKQSFLKVEVEDNIEPSRKLRLKRLMELMEGDVGSLQKVIGYCSRRINHSESTEAKDKVLSLSDKSVGFIKKGDREAVIGYKPQLGRSKKGFITAFKLPQGNGSDSGQFLEVCRDDIKRTMTIPENISTDDGYANKRARNELLEMGVKVVSISGSKGKRIISPEDWENEEYVKARNDRSAVESLMFTIKHDFDFGHVMRRGIENVRAELLERVIAYNFCRIILVKSKLKYPLELAA
jgi:hypothetical protein